MYTSIPMRGRIKESHCVITKISPSDNSREVAKHDSITLNLINLIATSNDNVVNTSFHNKYCSVN